MFVRMLMQQFLRQAAEDQITKWIAQQRQGTADREGPSPTSSSDSATDESRRVVPEDVHAIVFCGEAVESAGLVARLSNMTTTRAESFVEHVGWIGQHAIAVVQTGGGAEQASKVAENVLRLYPAPWVVAAGFVAALTPELTKGKCVMAREVVGTKGQRLMTGLQMDENDRLCVSWAEVRRPPRTQEERMQVGERLSADVCNLEGFALASACQAFQRRLLVTGIVTEALDEQWPAELRTVLAQKTVAGKLGAASRGLIQRPAVVKQLWKMRESELRASKKLGAHLERILQKLS